MHDSGGLVCGDSDEFEEVARRVGPDHEEPLLAVVLVLDVPKSVLPGVGDRGIVDPVLSSRRGDLHTRQLYLYTPASSRLCLRGAGAAGGKLRPVSRRTTHAYVSFGCAQPSVDKAAWVG